MSARLLREFNENLELTVLLGASLSTMSLERTMTDECLGEKAACFGFVRLVRCCVRVVLVSQAYEVLAVVKTI